MVSLLKVRLPPLQPPQGVRHRAVGGIRRILRRRQPVLEGVRARVEVVLVGLGVRRRHRDRRLGGRWGLRLRMGVLGRLVREGTFFRGARCGKLWNGRDGWDAVMMMIKTFLSLFDYMGLRRM